LGSVAGSPLGIERAASLLEEMDSVPMLANSQGAVALAGASVGTASGAAAGTAGLLAGGPLMASADKTGETAFCSKLQHLNGHCGRSTFGYHSRFSKQLGRYNLFSPMGGNKQASGLRVRPSGTEAFAESNNNRNVNQRQTGDLDKEIR